MRFVSFEDDYPGFISIGRAPVGVIAIGVVPVGVIAIGMGGAVGGVTLACGVSAGLVNVFAGAGIGLWVAGGGAGYGFFRAHVGGGGARVLPEGRPPAMPAPHPAPDDLTTPEAVLASNVLGWVEARIVRGEDEELRLCAGDNELATSPELVARLLLADPASVVYARVRAATTPATAAESVGYREAPSESVGLHCEEAMVSLSATAETRRAVRSEQLRWWTKLLFRTLPFALLTCLAVWLAVARYGQLESSAAARVYEATFTRSIEARWPAVVVKSNLTHAPIGASCTLVAHLRTNGKETRHLLGVECGSSKVIADTWESWCTAEEIPKEARYTYRLKCDRGAFEINSTAGRATYDTWGKKPRHLEMRIEPTSASREGPPLYERRD